MLPLATRRSRLSKTSLLQVPYDVPGEKPA